MISIRELRALSIEWGVSMSTIEKAYGVSWLLHVLAEDAALKDLWIIKGNTAMERFHLETWRFEPRLDIAILSNVALNQSTLVSVLQRLMKKAQEISGIEMQIDDIDLSISEDTQSAGGHLSFRSVGAGKPILSIPLTFSRTERPIESPIRKKPQSIFGDATPQSDEILTYTFPSLFFDTVRDFLARIEAKHLYDSLHLFWRHDSPLHDPAVHEFLASQFSSRDLLSLASPERLSARKPVWKLQSEWEGGLKSQMISLPPFEHFWSSLPFLFEWLQKKYVQTEGPILISDENIDATWTPPATISYWGFGIPLESIRFAATNRLCLQLGYGGTKRLVEPYAIRLTLDGNIILCARRVDTGNPRSYRIDRIESLWITDIPFEPVYKIEMGSVGPVTVLPTSGLVLKES